MKKNEFSNNSEGFNRYILGPEVVLNSRTRKEAIQKATQIRREYQFSDLNYPFTCPKMWKEYRFLFLCTFVEFKLAELIYKKRKRIAGEYIKNKKLQINKHFTPRCLLIEKKCNLGKLIDIIDCHMKFKGKNKLVKRLRVFGKKRNAFVHHSFSSQTNNNYILKSGIHLGKDVLKLLAKIC